jgi:polysaccharide deacetylase family sporulation protein PdaB
MRVIYIKKSSLIICCVILASALILTLFSSPAIIGASASKRQLPIYCVSKEDKVASLSFDAAWGNEDTEQLIEILGRYGVKATFFVVGDWVDKYPESVKALADAGHEIMNHSNKHKHMPRLSREDIISDITACNDKIEKITGVRPTLFRPPYGDYDDKLITTVTSMGMYTIQWDVDSLDWKDLSAADIQKRVLSRVKPGSIVLFHNAALNTPEALPGIIESLQSSGYKLIPISEIIYTGEFYLDHEGRQFPVKDVDQD